MGDNDLNKKISDFDLEVVLQQTKVNIPFNIAKKLIAKWEEIRSSKEKKDTEQDRRRRIDEDIEKILGEV